MLLFENLFYFEIEVCIELFYFEIEVCIELS